MKRNFELLLSLTMVMLLTFALPVVAREEGDLDRVRLETKTELELGKPEVEDEDSLDDELEVEVELEDLEDDLDEVEIEDEDGDDRRGENSGRGRGEEHRSEVADFVEKLLEVADDNGSLGEEIRKIAREQASSSEEVTEAIEKIENRGKFKVFLIGTDYKNLGSIRSELSKMTSRVEALKREMEKLIPIERDILGDEVSSLENEIDKLESFIEDNEDRFSLFGWVAKLLTK